MTFQLAYGERSVLVSALTIAIQRYRERLADARLGCIHGETRAQLNHAESMLTRLVGTTPIAPWESHAPLADRIDESMTPITEGGEV